MASYKEIHGTKIEAVAEDPSNPVEGQVWYNTTSNVVKGSIRTAAGSWATTSALNTARFYGSGAGTVNSAIMVSGETPSGDTPNVETWNGSSWTEIANISDAKRGGASAGADNTAVIEFGGYTPSPAGNVATCEYWNGSSWTEVADLNTARRYLAGSGEYPSALAYGGYISSGVANTESWNGSAWTEVNDLNNARNNMGSCGTDNTNALLSGSNTESWNGSTWTEIADLNAARGAQGAGNTSNAIFFGGPPTSALTEEWDGSSWTEVGDLNTGREGLAGDGIYTAALAMSGTPSSPQNALTASEQWTGAGSTLTRTFTVD